MSVNVEMLKAYIEANTYRFSSFFRQKYFPFSKKIKMVDKIKLKFDGAYVSANHIRCSEELRQRTSCMLIVLST